MRLSTDESRDEELALATIAAAAEAGITVFDTARSYGRGADDVGHNEKLLARTLRSSGAHTTARIVTKGGMARTGDGWIPDGRAKTLRADCEASLAALDGVPIDLYLIHAPDPRTPWRTSVRALARLLDEGLVKRVGLSNVNRSQLDEALEVAPVSAVQVAVSPYDDRAVRGGVVQRCAAAGIAVIAHSPLGGPRRAGRLARHKTLTEIADAHGATPTEIALAWLLGLSPVVVAIPGARRPETARSAARAAPLRLESRDRRALDKAFGVPRPVRPKRSPRRGDADVVLVMGIPGAGKARLAGEYVARGYLRLNRDERGGTLRELAGALDEALAAGVRLVVLDNTYLMRAARSHVIETASRHGVPTRCIWLDTPLAQAQVNLVERLLERFGSLPPPEELRRLAPPGTGCPHAGVADAGAARARAAIGGRGVRRRGAGGLRAQRAVGARASRCLRRSRRVAATGVGGRARGGRPACAAPRLRLEPQREGGWARRRRGGSLRHGVGTGGARTVRPPGRSADLLVPTAASGATARVRAGTSGRPVPLDPDRNELRPSDARDDAGRSARPSPSGCESFVDPDPLARRDATGHAPRELDVSPIAAVHVPGPWSHDPQAPGVHHPSIERPVAALEAAVTRVADGVPANRACRRGGIPEGDANRVAAIRPVAAAIPDRPAVGRSHARLVARVRLARGAREGRRGRLGRRGRRRRRRRRWRRWRRRRW
jgi:aryl-alcohol dehydrogenase-like predicted oxidoreductase